LKGPQGATSAEIVATISQVGKRWMNPDEVVAKTDPPKWQAPMIGQASLTSGFVPLSKMFNVQAISLSL
jgi:hypothetical protein